jgi:hypothetical protein
MCPFLALNVFRNCEDTHFPLSGCSPTTIEFNFVNIYYRGYGSLMDTHLQTITTVVTWNDYFGKRSTFGRFKSLG